MKSPVASFNRSRSVAANIERRPISALRNLVILTKPRTTIRQWHRMDIQNLIRMDKHHGFILTYLLSHLLRWKNSITKLDPAKTGNKQHHAEEMFSYCHLNGYTSMLHIKNCTWVHIAQYKKTLPNNSSAQQLSQGFPLQIQISHTIALFVTML